MKKIISFLICIGLIFSLSITAQATDVSKIEPSTTTYIIGITDKDVPVSGLPAVNPGQIIIIAESLGPGYNYNPITGRTVETKKEEPEQDTTTNVSTVETNTDVDEPTNKEDVDTTPATPSEKKQLIEEIFKLVNEERTKANLNELNYNFELQNAADIRARECAEHFSHTRPDGTSCFTVVDEIDYGVVGENLIKADNPIATAQALVNSWMNSEGHKANILNSDFTETAIGIYINDGVTYGAEIFMG